jgi:hypothetical protein
MYAKKKELHTQKKVMKKLMKKSTHIDQHNNYVDFVRN